MSRNNPTRRAVVGGLGAAPFATSVVAAESLQIDESIFAALEKLHVVQARYDAACENLDRVEELYYSDPAISAAAAPVEWGGKTFVDLAAFDAQTSLFSDHPKVVELRRMLVERSEIFDARDRQYGLTAAQAEVIREARALRGLEDEILDMTPMSAGGSLILLRTVASTLDADRISMGDSGESKAFLAINRALAVLEPLHVSELREVRS
ncbi:hypothetical protein [Methylosinus sp. KRF6]|uniref:hypothetical protein n=1 Tax=Methylosinus sp. KRF6 TaxID=2846853 RepID=UPI001C0B1B25|nr:hypothetical protein [Methylosinus sp. KRF6]MBU3887213.1 hypothetical protein [Methylosinus sp. KRF6]